VKGHAAVIAEVGVRDRRCQQRTTTCPWRLVWSVELREGWCTRRTATTRYDGRQDLDLGHVAAGALLGDCG